jgi:hypothetical protein
LRANATDTNASPQTPGRSRRTPDAQAGDGHGLPLTLRAEPVAINSRWPVWRGLPAGCGFHVTPVEEEPVSDENTNGLLRQYFPKGADLSVYSQAHLNKVARQLNERPRKTLGFETPAEKFNACVASTG